MLLDGLPGLRLVAMNTDYGYSANFYSFLNDRNKYYHLHQEWVYSTMEKAQSAGEKVQTANHSVSISVKLTYHVYYLSRL